MQQPAWNNLTAEFRRQVETRNCLVLAQLTPNVVTHQVPSKQLAIDWDHVILLKYCGGSPQRRGTTIVWTAYAGFVRTDVAPRTLIDGIERDSPVTWLDMQAYTDVSGGRGPLSYVLGRLQLIPIENKQNHYSWLNGRYLQTVNPYNSKQAVRQSLIMLKTTNEILIQDSAERLIGKWRTADKIRRVQQMNKEYNDKLYGSHYLANVQLPPDLKKFRIRVQALLMAYVERHLPLNLTTAEMNKVVDAARHNRPWPLDEPGPTSWGNRAERLPPTTHK
ncbi:hypothetical protein [Levilactobacillus acidifarinae]|uniref:Uncharacterized protein n=1 Tax=Levilactobacillus acidifarinae DSM 19394 = JCM 15949 TaxID=1423715 RepID=A0A0R1LGX2_9LACO|nr:hypothetical protein [Levilactobacillus acidifarinae]KRK94959.1 hypothetical protein FD25_GL002144 [Levilactobacillus acidifarinae DSM 19394]GEO70113.1 hypothetical protein LAC03_20230 [Levilactobacillus acidifarinae]